MTRFGSFGPASGLDLQLDHQAQERLIELSKPRAHGTCRVPADFGHAVALGGTLGGRAQERPRPGAPARMMPALVGHGARRHPPAEAGVKPSAQCFGGDVGATNGAGSGHVTDLLTRPITR